LQTNVPSTATLGGRYRLLRRIGSGGVGAVWEARDELLERPVAVKVLSQALCNNETVAARFLREAQAAGRLTHPNIAQVFDYGEEDGCPYIVLELVAGSTLRERLERRGRLPPGDVAEIGAQIADALEAAHAAGIVHRDVKPGNVMIAPDGRVKVMDFGIADAVWFEPLTDTGTIMATALYISPEQATGGGATGASDVYSLGAVLYELFAGRLPFDGDSPLAIAHGHAYEAPEPLAEAAGGVPAAMREAVEWAMNKDPRERPTAAELAAALRAVGRPPGATLELPVAGPSPAARAERAPAATRRAGAVVLGGVVAVVLLLALAFLALGSAPSGQRPVSRESPPSAAAAQTDTPKEAASEPAPRKDGGGDADGRGHGPKGPDHGKDGPRSGKGHGPKG
jgi:serine/threonine protein kinase